AVATFIDVYQNIGIVNFRKELDFRKDLVFSVAAKIGTFVCTIPLAIILKNYWALVGGILVGTLVRIVMSYIMQNYRPRISFACWQEIMGFSKWLVINNFLSFLFNRSDTFIL